MTSARIRWGSVGRSRCPAAPHRASSIRRRGAGPVTDPLSRAARDGAGGRRWRGRRPRRRARDPRAPAEGRAGRLLDQRRDAAGADRRGRRRARSPSGCAERARRAARRSSVERIEVAGPGLSQPLPRRPLAPRGRGRAARRRRRARRRPPREPRAGPGRVRERQPDRPGDRGERRAAPPTATRSRACSSAPGHAVEREYYVNDAGTQVRLFAESIAARMRGAEPPEDGYEGDYVAELAAELAARGPMPTTSTRSRRAAIEAMRARIEATLERFGVELRHLVLGAQPARLGRRRARRSTSCASAGTSTTARARSGCARPSSATTRTGS